MHVEVVAAAIEHIEPIVVNARLSDVDELWAIARATPRKCLELGLRLSVQAHTALVDGVPVGMWGVTPYSILGGIGTPWMVATNALEALSVQKQLLRLSRAGLVEMREQFPLLFNVVDDRNTGAHRWLSWLGFTLGEPTPMGPDRRPFRAFYLETP